MNFGFVKVAAAIPEVRVADCKFNLKSLLELIQQANNADVEVVCFPELCVTACTCGDLFFSSKLQADALESIMYLCNYSNQVACVLIVGAPLKVGNTLYNCAFVMHKGKILGIVPKTNITYQSQQTRYFASGKTTTELQTINLSGENEIPFGTNLIFKSENFTFGVEINEDLFGTPIPASAQLAIQGAEIICNLSANNDLIGKHAQRMQTIAQQSTQCNVAYVYTSAGYGESTTDLVFGGNALIAENGLILSQAERFSLHPQLIINEIDVEQIHAERIRNNNFETDKKGIYRTVSFVNSVSLQHINKLTRILNPHPFVPTTQQRESHCQEVFNIQVASLAKRWQHTGAQNIVLGISGGLDSTLALLVGVKTADKLGYNRKQIMGITMPGFGTTDRTYHNAINLMKSLGITLREIPIKEAALQHFKDIEHNPNLHDVTYENTQARERTQILMDVANQIGGLVVGTGDLSELALGWATYNGDHMSMYGVNAGVPKTLVRYLVQYAATQLDKFSEQILIDITETPVSPELLPADNDGNIAQITEDLVGPYELHDFFLYYFVQFGYTQEKIMYLAKQAFDGKYTEQIIAKWLAIFMRRFYGQQFKRNCMPDGPKITAISLSPRGDWHMPSDACW